MLALAVFSASEAVAQQATIHGTVVAAASGKPLPGAKVSLQADPRSGTTTDAEGSFTLEVPNPDATVVVSYLGYRAAEVPLNGKTRLVVRLTPNAVQLDELVVVGYGTQRKSDVTGSVASVDMDQIENLPSANALQSLQGAVPGLSIRTAGGGAEGSHLAFNIRGSNSITASNRPLLVLDGIPFNGSISEIQPSDIESIDVLKDASAAAIYGARGSNGVILITTKKGSGEPRFSYNGYAGVQQISHQLDLMTGPEYAAFKCQREAGGENCDAVLTPTERENLAAGNFTDWVDLATRPGFQQQHNLTMSGGAGGMRYYLSGSALDVRGVAVNDDFQRYGLRLNLDNRPNNWLRVGTHTNLSYSDRSGMGADFADAVHQNPLTNAWNEDGTLKVTPWPEDRFFANPLQGLNVVDNDITRRVTSSNYLEVELPFLEGLSYRFNGGIDFANDHWARYYGRDTRTGLNYQGYAQRHDANRFDWTTENLLRFDRDFGAHRLDLTALYGAQKYSYVRDEANSREFPNDFLTFYQMGVGSLIRLDTDFEESALVSQMGRLNYAYDGRYLVTLTARRDGYSGFGQNYKYGIFPSLALGWNVSNESFWPFYETLNALKLRLSYGRNGNQAVGPYALMARMGGRSYVRDGSTWPGYVPSSLGNPDLKWEGTSTINLGADFGLFDDRITGSVDAYSSRTTDLLLNRRISSVHGIGSIVQNLGEVRNRGLELQLTSRNVETPDFTWSTDFTFGANRNEIADLYGDGLSDVRNRWFIGRPIDVNYAYEMDGIFQNEEEIAASAQPDAEPGDARVLDVNEDGKITEADRTFIGSAYPSFTAGLANTLSYGGATLSFRFYMVQGLTRRNGMRDPGLVMDETRRSTIDMDYWTPENPDAVNPANRPGSNPYGVGFYEDASYIRLTDATLGYEVPEAMTQRLGMHSLNIYVSGRNLGLLTDWTGLDPEFNSQRGIPPERVLTAGIRLGF